MPPNCENCGAFAPVVWVHGHGQCSVCKAVMHPCCDGAAQPVLEVTWLPHGQSMPEGYELAQAPTFLMHHNHYAVLIRKAA